MKSPQSARLLAGAFLLLASAAPSRAAEPLKLALERPGGPCEAPAAGSAFGLLPLTEKRPEGTGAAGCVVEVTLAGLTDEELDDAATRLTSASASPALILRIPAAEIERTVYGIKRLASSFRAASLEGKIGLDRGEPLPADADEELAAYVDALVLAPGGRLPADSARAAWILAPASETASPIAAVLQALQSTPRRHPRRRALGRSHRHRRRRGHPVAAPEVLHRATFRPTRQRRRGRGAMARPLRCCATSTPRPSRRSCSFRTIRRARRASRSRAARTRRRRSRTSRAASRRDFELKGAPVLTLDLSRGPLAVVLTPAARPGGETKAAVDVGAIRGSRPMRSSRASAAGRPASAKRSARTRR